MSETQPKSELLFDAEAKLRLAAVTYANAESNPYAGNTIDATCRRTVHRKALREAAMHYARTVGLVDDDGGQS